MGIVPSPRDIHAPNRFPEVLLSGAADPCVVGMAENPTAFSMEMLGCFLGKFLMQIATDSNLHGALVARAGMRPKAPFSRASEG